MKEKITGAFLVIIPTVLLLHIAEQTRNIFAIVILGAMASAFIGYGFYLITGGK